MFDYLKDKLLAVKDELIAPNDNDEGVAGLTEVALSFIVFGIILIIGILIMSVVYTAANISNTSLFYTGITAFTSMFGQTVTIIVVGFLVAAAAIIIWLLRGGMGGQRTVGR